METSPFRAKRMLTDPRWIVVAAMLVAATAVVWLLGEVLVPIAIAFVLAYFLDGGVELLCRHRCRRGVGVTAIYSLFLLVYLVGVLGPLQLAVGQLLRLLRVFPDVVQQLRELLTRVELPESLEWVAPQSEGGLSELIITNVRDYGEELLGHMLGGVTGATSWAFYLFLIPLLVLFLLKDKEELRSGLLRVLPREREFASQIWAEMELRMSNYVRGKVWEILIVGLVTWAALYLLDFQYAVITAILAGISVVIPYIGAAAVTVPVFLLGLAQWGVSEEVAWVVAAYVVIQFVDGNVLVPLLFSEVVQLSPTVIMLAIMVFGAMFGLWGVFFAIPLATLIKAVVATYVEYRDAPQS